MLAIGLNDSGGPEVLQLVELPYPHPASGQVRAAGAVALGNDDGLCMVAIASPEDEAFLRAAGAAEFIARGKNAATFGRPNALSTRG